MSKKRCRPSRSLTSIHGVNAAVLNRTSSYLCRMRRFDTLPPQGMEYWSRLSAYINTNPVQEPDLFYLGMLTSSGWSSIRLLIYVKGGPTNWIKKLVVNFIQTRFECEAYPHTGC